MVATILDPTRQDENCSVRCIDLPTALFLDACSWRSVDDLTANDLEYFYNKSVCVLLLVRLHDDDYYTT